MKRTIIGIAVVVLLAGLAFILLSPATDEESIAQEEVAPIVDVAEPEVSEAPVTEPEPEPEEPLEEFAAAEAEPTGADRLAPQIADAFALGDITSSISEYFEAAAANDTERAAAVTKPESAVLSQMDEMAQADFYPKDVLFEVLADESHAIAVSELVSVERPNGRTEEGFLLFFLDKSDSGSWLIYDIDFESGDSGSEELDRFVERYPDATYLLQFDE